MISVSTGLLRMFVMIRIVGIMNVVVVVLERILHLPSMITIILLFSDLYSMYHFTELPMVLSMEPLSYRLCECPRFLITQM